MKRANRRQHGIAMLLVLTMVVVASIVGTNYLSIASVKLAGSTNMVRASEAMYLAESGIHHAMWLLRTDSSDLAAASPAAPLGPFQLDADGGQYVLYVEPMGTPLEYLVTAKGTAMGITRTSQAVVRIYSEYKDKVLAMGPVRYWRLGEIGGDVAVDAAGSTNGKYKNSPQRGQPGAICGDTDGSVHLDGIEEYVNAKGIDISGNSMTLLCWFKADDFSIPDYRFISKADGLASNDCYWMLGTVQSNGKMVLRMRIKTGGSTGTMNATSGTLETNKWTMAIFTFAEPWVKLYKDAKQVGMGVKFGGINMDGDVKTWIGANPTEETDRPFHGSIDEVAIFSRALSSSEITELYQARIARLEIVSWEK